MAKEVNIGIASIKVGDIASDGGMGTVLAPLGETAEDSCKLTFGDQEETAFYVEEHDNPIHVEYKQGDVDLTFNIYEYDFDTVVKVFGGSVDSNGYKAPVVPVTIEKSLELKPRKGKTFKFPRVSITAKFTSDIGKKNLMAIEVKAKVLSPKKEGEPRFTLS